MDGSVAVRAAKRTLRRDLLAARRALPRAAVEAASLRVVAALRDLPELVGVRDVLLYLADPDELDLADLIGAPPDPWRVHLPRVIDGAVRAVPYRAGEPLVTGPLGIREPSGAAVDPGVLDAVVVPGVAFGPAGERLGRGGGMYDRLLPTAAAAVRIGVCLETFVLDAVPVEDHDVRVDVVVTDASVRRRDVAARRGPT